MSFSSKNLVIMFVKEPKLGFVKTRLAKTCGDEFTLELYKCFVKDLIKTLDNEKFDFKLCAYPDLELINRTFGNFDNFLQCDGDLGLKMKTAFKEQFSKEYENIILIGSDTPHIKKEMFYNTFEKLNDNDIVIGESLDGGYYLIAFNKDKFIPEVFDNISWSTEIVLAQTLQKLHAKKVYLHQVLNDIDILEDLQEFYNAHHNSAFQNSFTVEFLKKNKSKII